MTDEELQVFLGWDLNRLNDEWKAWAKSVAQSAKVDTSGKGNIQREDAILYLCQIMQVFESLREDQANKAITEDHLRGKFISGLVISGLPPQTDASFFFSRALQNTQERGFVTYNDVGWGSEEERFYRLTVAGQKLAETATVVEPTETSQPKNDQEDVASNLSSNSTPNETEPARIKFPDECKTDDLLKAALIAHQCILHVDGVCSYTWDEQGQDEELLGTSCIRRHIQTLAMMAKEGWELMPRVADQLTLASGGVVTILGATGTNAYEVALRLADKICVKMEACGTLDPPGSYRGSHIDPDGPMIGHFLWNELTTPEEWQLTYDFYKKQWGKIALGDLSQLPVLDKMVEREFRVARNHRKEQATRAAKATPTNHQSAHNGTAETKTDQPDYVSLWQASEDVLELAEGLQATICDLDEAEASGYGDPSPAAERHLYIARILEAAQAVELLQGEKRFEHIEDSFFSGTGNTIVDNVNDAMLSIFGFADHIVTRIGLGRFDTTGEDQKKIYRLVVRLKDERDKLEAICPPVCNHIRQLARKRLQRQATDPKTTQIIRGPETSYLILHNHDKSRPVFRVDDLREDEIVILGKALDKELQQVDSYYLSVTTAIESQLSPEDLVVLRVRWKDFQSELNADSMLVTDSPNAYISAHYKAERLLEEMQRTREERNKPTAPAAVANTREQDDSGQKATEELATSGGGRMVLTSATDRDTTKQPEPVAQDPFLSHIDLATRYVREPEATRKMLDRWRGRNGDGWHEVDNRKMNEPKYLYRLSAVRQLFEKNPSVGASSERPTE